MDVATEKTVVIRMTEAEAERVLVEIAPLAPANDYPQLGHLWQLLDDILG